MHIILLAEIGVENLLGIIKDTICEDEFACDFSSMDFFEGKYVRISEFASHIVGSPDEDDMDQGETYKGAENSTH